MPKRTVHGAVVVFVIASGAVASAQSLPSPEPPTVETSATSPIDHNTHAWEAAQSGGKSERRLQIITADQPERKQTCRVKSFTSDKLVCAHGVGGSRTYTPAQVIAVIIPGDMRSRIPIFVGFNVGLGAAIWGTVVLAAACPACAAATALAALICFSAAGAFAYADDQPDRVLYLTPDPELRRKAGYSGSAE